MPRTMRQCKVGILPKSVDIVRATVAMAMNVHHSCSQDVNQKKIARMILRICRPYSGDNSVPHHNIHVSLHCEASVQSLSAKSDVHDFRQIVSEAPHWFELAKNVFYETSNHETANETNGAATAIEPFVTDQATTIIQTPLNFPNGSSCSRFYLSLAFSHLNSL